MSSFFPEFRLKSLEIIKRYIGYTFSDISVNCVSDADNAKNNSIIFFNGANIEINLAIKNSLVILREDSIIKNLDESNFLLYSSNPRLDFAIILNHIAKYSPKKEYIEKHLNIIIGQNAKIANTVYIEPNVFIDNDVVIGDGTYIESGARIFSRVSIGENCRIGSNSTIGLSGFGVEIDNEGKSYRIPHFGGVSIGNNVVISSLCNIHAGTVNPTVIEDYVQLDALVHIGHNCIIKKSSMITACAEISGSVVLEEKSYVGPNSSIINKITIGENTLVGIGAVVTKSFSKDSRIAGNPADLTSNLKNKNTIIKELIAQYGKKN
ncbi:MAG: UDP-3-O-(3-hydroxymyristoyl)glucosamine N-acyltransferase [Acholeplasma sp.]|nr:UDP-3-O-(3-hydroxymyristoyl)glucosamine N-acyltransferase [Acholeplasma sp.]